MGEGERGLWAPPGAGQERPGAVGSLQLQWSLDWAGINWKLGCCGDDRAENPALAGDSSRAVTSLGAQQGRRGVAAWLGWGQCRTMPQSVASPGAQGTVTVRVLEGQRPAQPLCHLFLPSPTGGGVLLLSCLDVAQLWKSPRLGLAGAPRTGSSTSCIPYPTWAEPDQSCIPPLTQAEPAPRHSTAGTSYPCSRR